MKEDKKDAIKVDLECAIIWLKDIGSTDSINAIEDIKAAIKELEELSN